jgi:two-component system cell cycle sensor histidine kinase/response regulator CckA
MHRWLSKTLAAAIAAAYCIGAAILAAGLFAAARGKVPLAMAPCLLALLAAADCFRAARASCGAEKMVWAFLGGGAAGAAAAQILSLIAGSRSSHFMAAAPANSPLWLALCYWIFAGFYLAVFLKPHQAPDRRVRPAAVVDVLLLGLLLIGVFFYLSAVRRSGLGHDRGLAGAALVAGIGLAAAAGMLGARRQALHARWRTIYLSLAAAALCQAASEALSLLLHNGHGTAAVGLLQMSAFALIAWAARRPRDGGGNPRGAAPDYPQGVPAWRELAVPSLVLLGLLGIPLLDLLFSGPARLTNGLSLENTVLAAVIGIYVLLVLVRQFLVQMENRELALDLQRESLRLRLLVNHIQDAVIAEDLQGRIVFANDRFLEMFGLNPSQLGRLRFEDCIHPEDRRLRPGLHGPLPGGPLGAVRFEFRGIRSDGSVLYLESSTAPVRPGGMILGYQSVIRDITERRKAEEQQRELAQRLEFLVSNTPLGCLVFDLDFRILEWNSSASRIFGFSAAEAFGRSALELLVPPEIRSSVEAGWRELVKSKSSDHRLQPNLTKDRGVIECEWFNTSLIDAAGRVAAIASMVQDVTERRNLEAQLRQSQKMEAIGVLAGGIAHDFNNLLTVIVGNISLALLHLGAAHPAARGLQDAEKAAARAAGLVQQLLGFSRKSPGSPRALNLNACVRETAELLRSAVDPRIAIQIEEDPRLWLVQADPGQVHQVLINLCVNARDAMENGGRLTIATANRVVEAQYCRLHPEARPGEFVEVSVSDTGAGMDRAVLARIFEPFFTTKQVGKGTGLGLSMAYGIVRQHGGWITVASELGKGSTFSVFLPRAQTGAGDGAPQAAAPAPAGSETILLVEDDPMVRSVGRAILENSGYRVIEAGDGEQAVRIFEHSAVDLVLLDMTMPRKSGRDTLLEFRRIAPEVPVVMASGYASTAADELVRMGASAFVQKPYRPDELIRTLRKVLDSFALSRS